MHAHDGLEVDHRARFRARVQAVQRDAGAHHIEVHVGIADGCSRVGGMDDAGVDAGHAHALDSLEEALRLYVKVQRLGRIGRGEVGERAHQVERAVEAHLRQELHHLVVAHADAVHARVHGQVVRRADAEGVGRLGVADGEVGRVDARHDLVGQQQGNGLVRGLREHEDGRIHQCLAQLDGLVDRGHAQILGTGVQRRLRAAHRTVPVAVGLHHGHDAHAGSHVALEGRHVVAQGVQIDLRPGPATVGVGDEAQLVGVEARRARVGPRMVARILERPLRAPLVASRDARERRAAACGVASHRRVPHAGAGRLEARLAVREPGESVR